MGTNFYWHDKPCTHCGRYDEVHVGKSGFIFRAYRHVLLNEEHPDWGYLEESPFGAPILTVKDWAAVFVREGELWNEYGEQIPDPMEWLSTMTPYELTEERRRWLDDAISSGDGWLDPRRLPLQCPGVQLILHSEHKEDSGG